MKNTILYKSLIVGLTVLVIVLIISFATRTVLTATATLNFPSTAAGTSSDLTMTLTGAAVGDAIALGAPNGSVLTNGCFFAWVSNSDEVTVRFLNNALLASLDPASGTYRVSVIKN